VAAAALALAGQSAGTQDWRLLSEAVDRLLTGGFTGAYSDPSFLEGPLTLGVGLVFHPVPHAAQVWAVLAGLALGPLLLLTRRLSWSLALLPVVPWAAFAASGHPDDLAAVVLLILACRSRPGVLVAVAAAFKPWAVAGVATFRNLRTWMIFAGLSVVLWLPMLLAHPATQAQWTDARPASPMLLVFGRGTLPDWTRPVQLLLVVAVAWLAARWVGPERAILAALVVRVMTEAGDFDYYFGPLALLAAVTGSRRATALTTLAWAGKFAPAPAVVRLVVLAAALAVVLLPERVNVPALTVREPVAA
jgi:hypothetical protein